ncbi:hypothetical protein HNQ64_004880 [Prosthecobacter dejongeii]|uniref:Uncharacterized protein n=1 Tax=Prosthecobacter dejongeii TaxID=48465 RepID=A0A7W8DSK1_9BACT|nr:hypothetical protein [Prosthecobacter dejongeii]
MEIWKAEIGKLKWLERGIHSAVVRRGCDAGCPLMTSPVSVGGGVAGRMAVVMSGCGMNPALRGEGGVRWGGRGVLAPLQGAADLMRF